MSTALNPEVLERAKECLAGRSRSYVEDAKLFARLVLDYAEAAKTRMLPEEPAGAEEEPSL